MWESGFPIPYHSNDVSGHLLFYSKLYGGSVSTAFKGKDKIFTITCDPHCELFLPHYIPTWVSSSDPSPNSPAEPASFLPLQSAELPNLKAFTLAADSCPEGLHPICHSLNFYSSFKQELKLTLSAMHSLASLFDTVGPSHPCSGYGNRVGPLFYVAVLSLLINYTTALHHFNL